MKTKNSIMDRLGNVFGQYTRKSLQNYSYISMHDLGRARWSGRNTVALSKMGFEKNPIAHQCIRMISESGSSVKLNVIENNECIEKGFLTKLIENPNPDQTRTEFLQDIYGYLQTAGNAYVHAVCVEGEVRALYPLRPDRMKVIPDASGYPAVYEYTVSGETRRFHQTSNQPCPPILHLKQFNPVSDHYGLAPLRVAADAIELHNAATAWNKSLLDNAARPSGALVYQGVSGAENLTVDQFDRLKSELSETYQGSGNAGRPLVLDGGLDWKPMSLSPSDMDFLNAKHSAAREIALSFGVPPMLLGIPGDNTYSNYREANLAYWRSTILPLVNLVADALTHWLAPMDMKVILDTGNIEALSSERNQNLQRILDANFLTDQEKRIAMGYPAVPDDCQSA